MPKPKKLTVAQAAALAEASKSDLMRWRSGYGRSLTSDKFSGTTIASLCDRGLLKQEGYQTSAKITPAGREALAAIEGA